MKKRIMPRLPKSIKALGAFLVVAAIIHYKVKTLPTVKRS